MTTTAEPPPEALVGLEYEAVRRWLERMHPTDVCGIAGIPDSCPLAVYLAEVNGLKREEGDWEIAVLAAEYEIDRGEPEEPMTGDLPDWAASFVERVDQTSLRGEVTAQQALEILDVALRYPHGEDMLYEDEAEDEDDAPDGTPGDL